MLGIMDIAASLSHNHSLQRLVERVVLHKARAKVSQRVAQVALINRKCSRSA